MMTDELEGSICRQRARFSAATSARRWTLLTHGVSCSEQVI